MYKIPLEKMVCDSDRGDGGIYFYEEYFEWIQRDRGTGFRVWYKSIKDVKVVLSQKKKVIIITNQGQNINLYLYKYEELLEILYKRMEDVKNGLQPIDAEVSEPASSQPEVKKSEDDLAKLERLAKLHDSGALTDEEFTAAKKKVLGL